MGEMHPTKPEEPLTGTEWARQEHMEMLRLGTTQDVWFDPEPD